MLGSSGAKFALLPIEERPECSEELLIEMEGV